MRIDDRTRGLGLGLAALLVYLRTLCPTVYEGDSGELVAAVASLGVPHPTGFPLYVMITKIATLVVPLGDVAFRANLVSAAFAAAAVSTTWFASRALGTSRAASAGASLFLAFSATLWSHATAARVYAMTAFFLALLLYVAIRWMRERNGSWLVVFGACLGLGAGTHVTVLLAVPAIIALVAATDRAAVASPELRRGGVIALVVAASLYLYVPLAARLDPAMNWGEPRDAGSLLYYLTQREYASIMGPAGARESLAVLGQAARGAFREFTPVGLLIALTGAWALRRRERAFLLATSLVVGCNVLLLMNYGYAAIGEVFPIHRYFYPAYLVMALWIGCGLDRLAELFAGRGAAGRVRTGRASGPGPREASRTRAAQVTLVALALIPLLTHFHAADRSQNRIVREYGANLLASVPEGGLLFTAGDAVSGSVWYLQIAERERPDVLHVQKDLLAQDWYARQMMRRHPAAVPSDLLAVPGADRWLRVADANLGARPVLSTALEPGRYANVPHGLVVEFAPPGAPIEPGEVARANAELWARYATAGVLDASIHRDVMVREMVRFYSKARVNLGVFHAEAGRTDDAAREYEEALRFDGENAVALLNLGHLLLARGDAARGRSLVDRGVAIAEREGDAELAAAGARAAPPGGAASPEATGASDEAVRAGIEFGRAGDHARAVAEFRRAIGIDSLNVLAWLSLGTAYLNMQQADSAITCYQRAVALEPGPMASSAWLNLGMIHGNVKGDPVRARECLQRFVDLNPSDPRVEAVKAEIARFSAMPAGRGGVPGRP